MFLIIRGRKKEKKIHPIFSNCFSSWLGVAPQTQHFTTVGVITAELQLFLRALKTSINVRSSNKCPVLHFIHSHQHGQTETYWSPVATGRRCDGRSGQMRSVTGPSSSQFTVAHARVLNVEAVFDLDLNNALGSGRQDKRRCGWKGDKVTGGK